LADNGKKFDYTSVVSDFKGDFKSNIHPGLCKLYESNYHNAISKVFGDPQSNGEYFNMVQQFKLNTSRFASYKAYQVTTRIKSLNKDDLKAFEKNANLILKKFNRYQATEYNTIVARSRTAKQFKQFEKEKDLYPNLEWIITRSADPREEHLCLVGTILPINDPFWDDNQPGNLWNCKCDWQTTDKPVTGTPDNITPSKGLAGNPAETGQIFSDDHPYFIDKGDKCELKRFIKQNTYTRIYQKDDVFIDAALQNKTERKKNINASILLAENHKESITLLPINNGPGIKSNDAIRHQYNNEWDYKILEGAKTKTGVQNAIKSASKKQNIIIFLKIDDINGLIEGLEAAFQEGRAKTIKLVDIYMTDNTMYKFSTDEIRSGAFIETLKTHKAKH